MFLRLCSRAPRTAITRRSRRWSKRSFIDCLVPPIWNSYTACRNSRGSVRNVVSRGGLRQCRRFEVPTRPPRALLGTSNRKAALESCIGSAPLLPKFVLRTLHCHTNFGSGALLHKRRQEP